MGQHHFYVINPPLLRACVRCCEGRVRMSQCPCRRSPWTSVKVLSPSAPPGLAEFDNATGTVPTKHPRTERLLFQKSIECAKSTSAFDHVLQTVATYCSPRIPYVDARADRTSANCLHVQQNISIFSAPKTRGRRQPSQTIHALNRQSQEFVEACIVLTVGVID